MSGGGPGGRGPLGTSALLWVPVVVRGNRTSGCPHSWPQLDGSATAPQGPGEGRPQRQGNFCQKREQAEGREKMKRKKKIKRGRGEGKKKKENVFHSYRFNPALFFNFSNPMMLSINLFQFPFIRTAVSRGQKSIPRSE